jgi:hypothetical protein
MNSASQYLPWQFPVSEQVEKITAETVFHLLHQVEQWGMHFHPESTWVEDLFFVPSLFVCVDFALSKDGEVGIYEIDERPCGIGLSCTINPAFKKVAEHMRDNVWPTIRVVKGMRTSDDEIFFGPAITLQQAFREKNLFALTRNRPEEKDFIELRDCSVSTVTKEGDKSYGLTLKLWETANVVQEGRRERWTLEREPTAPCVFKPRAGKCSHLVKVFYPRPPHGSRGIIKRRGELESPDRIARIIAERAGGQMYCQPFIEPMCFDHQPGKNGMYRFFFGYDIDSFEWVPLGGVWMASNSLVIQGSPKTVCGPLTFQE